MNRDQKAAVIDEIKTQIGESEAIFAVDYRGISVSQAAQLRGNLRDADATFRIVKNTLTERAADEAGAESLKSLLQGPTAFTFVKGDVALAAKALDRFRKEHALLEFKGGTMNGDEISIDEIQALAKLPALEVLHGQLVGIVASPITGLVRGLNGLISGIALQLGQIAEQGLVGGDAPAPEPEAEAAPEPEAEAAPEPEAEAPAEEPEASDAEAPGDPVAEGEAAEAEEETSETETETDEKKEG